MGQANVQMAYTHKVYLNLPSEEFQENPKFEDIHELIYLNKQFRILYGIKRGYSFTKNSQILLNLFDSTETIITPTEFKIPSKFCELSYYIEESCHGVLSYPDLCEFWMEYNGTNIMRSIIAEAVKNNNLAHKLLIEKIISHPQSMIMPFYNIYETLDSESKEKLKIPDMIAGQIPFND